ncbi:hypothetical protein ESP62_009950 [Aeromicrobium fastidiosum]|uniref:Uncharacterized protein n=2 Tax=Aeromicrobium fastidiosum TaxID=52699 RepID=A0A641APK5_9ACTN|nr:hypothetical protein ESP62_009950 [Aeromicrobium fastidiosum]
MNSTAHGEHDSHPADSVVVDCDRCLVRGPSACGDCVVTFLLGAPPAGIEIDADEMAALGVLSEAGLTPPLRLVTPVAGPETQAV